jgi:iron(III) transport system substrate-binding protein
MTKPSFQSWFHRGLALMLLIAGAAAGIAMKKQPASQLVVYCGRGEDLIRPLIAQFEQQHHIQVHIRYGGTAELAATILEEGRRSPADVFLAQDAGALGALARHHQLVALPDELLERVPPRFRAGDGTWVGVSGRARVVVYNPTRVRAEDLPASLDGFVDPAWRGRLGWAPENGSFQSFVTALIQRDGREKTRAWLIGMQANQPRALAKNSAIVAAVAAGEIDAGLVNHYYLLTARRSQPGINAENYFFPADSAGRLVNVAGAGVLASSKRGEAARAFVEFLLSDEAQRYFVEQTHEYPVIPSIALPENLPPLDSSTGEHLDLNDLYDLESTLSLLHEAGVL